MLVCSSVSVFAGALALAAADVSHSLLQFRSSSLFFSSLGYTVVIKEKREKKDKRSKTRMLLMLMLLLLLLLAL